MNLASLSTGRVFQALFLSFVICIVTAILATRFAVRVNLIDRPGTEPHKHHKHPVAVSGGIAFFSALLITEFIFWNRISPQFRGLTLAAAVIFGFALWDDFSHRNWKVKLGGQVLGCLVLILSGTRTHLFESFTMLPPAVQTVCDFALTLFWMTFITNAYNLVDSADGLMLGLAAWTSGFFIIASFDARQPDMAMYCAILLGSILTLTFFNSGPAILFMGDSGAQTIGFILAAVSIIYTPAEQLQKNTWFLPILMLGVPIFDTVLVTISRWRRGEHFYRSGTDHTYHRLIRMGFSTDQASGLMHLACFALESLGFFAISQRVIEANLIFAVVILLGIAAIYFLEREDLWKIVRNFIDTNEHLS